MIILLNVTNDACSRILTAQACSRAKILQFEILKLQSGATTLKNDFFPKVLFSSYRTLKVTSPVRFSCENIRVFQSNRKNSIFRTSAILELVIYNHSHYGYISNQNSTADSKNSKFWNPRTQFFLNAFFSKMRRQKYFFDFRFEISVKFRVE